MGYQRKLSPTSIKISDKDLEWMAGRLECKAVVGSSTMLKSYLIVDRDEQTMKDFARVLGIDPNAERPALGWYDSRNYTRYFGFQPASEEEEIKLWRSIYWHIRSDSYRLKVEKWLSRAGYEAPPRDSD